MNIVAPNARSSKTLAPLELSGWSLVAVNLLPLFGVLSFGWRAFDVVFLYWTENVVIGLINVLKMIACRPGPGFAQSLFEKRLRGLTGNQKQEVEEKFKTLMENGSPFPVAAKFFFIPFFTVHYGMFCMIHLVFISRFLGEGGPMRFSMNPVDGVADLLSNWGVLLSIFCLAASHLVSFLTNFIGKGEYLKTAAPILMMQPYARIVVLHMAIVLSGFFIVMFGSPIWLLVLLVIGKTMLDLKMHKKEHQALASEAIVS